MQKTPIGRRIKLARENSDTSQVRLGALLDPPKSGSAIADIEAGKSAVTWDTVMQVSRVLEVPIDFFTELYCPECLRTYVSGTAAREQKELDARERHKQQLAKDELGSKGEDLLTTWQKKLMIKDAQGHENEELIRDVEELVDSGPLVGHIENKGK